MKQSSNDTNAKNSTVSKNGESQIVTLVISLIILLVGNALFFLTIWLLNQYDRINIEQFLFAIKSSTVGTSGKVAGNAVWQIGGLTVLLSGVEALIYLIVSGKFKPFIKISRRYVKYTCSKICRFMKETALPFALAMFVFALSFFIGKLEVVQYINVSSTESDFIKLNYVNPNNVNLTFPKEKRNLVYIFLESMETTYSDTSAGGTITHNFIPELSLLAEENTNFSSTTEVGGALSFSGTTWTAAAMVAQTSGMLIKVPLNSQEYGGANSFLPGVSTIGEILEQQGYNQTLLLGSDADFGGRKTYFTDHGNYNIVDINSLKEEGRLPQNYRQWWGYEDKKLFEFAKEEILKLHEEGKPFNFTMLTADTHFPDGYVCQDCEENHTEQYANVLSCSSKKVYEFVNWLKEQPFYENTTIVLCGDHLTMDPVFLESVDQDYERTIYNCFINSAVSPIIEKNRRFGTFDMFPSTLAAMGVHIPGNRLGIGTNLFSEEITLTEKLGFEKLDEELQKKSLFYNEEILEMESVEGKIQ